MDKICYFEDSNGNRVPVYKDSVCNKIPVIGTDDFVFEIDKIEVDESTYNQVLNLKQANNSPFGF